MDFLRFLPLILFGWYARFYGLGPSGSDWKHAFYIGGLAAVCQIALLLYKRKEFDWIAFGANLFLTYGALGFATNELLLLPYAIFKQSVIFIWVFLVGLYTTYKTNSGFIQINVPDRSFVVHNSWKLLGLTALAFLISFTAVTHFNANTVLGVILPFVMLLFARKWLRNSLAKQANVKL